MIEELDFERGFFILQECMGHLRDAGEWEAVIRAFREKHGKLAAGVAATLEENVRRDVIKELRSSIAETEHRFFLALLMNVPARSDLLKLVAQRFPKVAPVETVLRWAEELAELSDYGIAILDAGFPGSLSVAIEKQSDLFLAALRHFMKDGKKIPDALRVLSAAQLRELRFVFAASSLGVLLV